MKKYFFYFTLTVAQWVWLPTRFVYDSTWLFQVCFWLGLILSSRCFVFRYMNVKMTIYYQYWKVNGYHWLLFYRLIIRYIYINSKNSEKDIMSSLCAEDMDQCNCISFITNIDMISKPFSKWCSSIVSLQVWDWSPVRILDYGSWCRDFDDR